MEDFRSRLALVAREVLRFHLDDIEVTTILLRDFRFAAELWSPELLQTMLRLEQRTTEYVTDAQGRGFVKEDIVPAMATGLIYLAFCSLLQMRELIKHATALDIQDDATLDMIVNQWLGMLFYGVLA